MEIFVVSFRGVHWFNSILDSPINDIICLLLIFTEAIPGYGMESQLVVKLRAANTTIAVCLLSGSREDSLYPAVRLSVRSSVSSSRDLDVFHSCLQWFVQPPVW